jgi:hypothetical protein
LIFFQRLNSRVGANSALDNNSNLQNSQNVMDTIQEDLGEGKEFIILIFEKLNLNGLKIML